jgi:nucleotide-binding universal stress UspA family protein
MYERILLALDGSELAEQALPPAVAQAERYRAELILLWVLEPFPEIGILWQEDVKRAEKQALDQARDYLEGLAATIQGRDLDVKPTVNQGQPGLTIVRFTETNGVGVIAICTRGRSGLSRWLVGSVAGQIQAEGP